MIMMSNPIPIDSSPHAPQRPKTPPSHLPVPSSQSPSSSMSGSPRTPFFPSSGMMSPPLATGLSTTAPPNTGFFKWASAFSKSPSVPENLKAQNNPIDPQHSAKPGPPGQERRGSAETDNGSAIDMSNQKGEDHDSFEFGDWNDIRSRGWNQNRRALSMSLPRGTPSGLSAMFGANGIMSAQQGGNMSQQAGAAQSGVMADKAAKAQGVLRRISFSGNKGVVPMLSPPLTQAMNSANQPNPMDAAVTGGSDGAPLARASTISGPPPSGVKKARRMSENRKRGVSPMGERLLRDHGHF